MARSGLAAGQAVAVIDIGSNSGRVVVYAPDVAGHLRLHASARAALRLISTVDTAHTLGPDATARLLDALADFQAIARGAGALRLKALATAAMRDAEDGPQLLRRIRRELGLQVEVIDGQREAHYGFIGALHGLSVRDGLLFDLGGGSLQATRFRARHERSAFSVPLGALRVSRAFLEADPPRPQELRQLRRHVRAVLKQAGLLRLRQGEQLVGTGGTLRNLAKIDRRARNYPITRVHGYELTRQRLGQIAADLAARRQRKRDTVPGLSDDRADSIVGGALVIETLMEAVGAEVVQVSGQGVREGLAYSLISPRLPSVEAVRETSIRSLGARFLGFRPAAAARRAGLALTLHDALAARGAAEMRAALRLAALLLDVGRSVDFFDRHEHAALFVLATDMNGFTHRELALCAAVLRRASNDDNDLSELQPLVREGDHVEVERAAVLLTLADDIEERCAVGLRIALRCRVVRGAFVVGAKALGFWRPRGLGRRFERAFGRPLVVRAGRD